MVKKKYRILTNKSKSEYQIEYLDLTTSSKILYFLFKNYYLVSMDYVWRPIEIEKLNSFRAPRRVTRIFPTEQDAVKFIMFGDREEDLIVVKELEI